MPREMGLGIVGDRSTVFRRKFRWMFTIPGIVGEEDTKQSIRMLPPLKSARPSIAIKEMEVRHLDEVVYFPGRQDWKTINITLYHIQCDNNPIYDWLKTIYDPGRGAAGSLSGGTSNDPFKYGLNPEDGTTDKKFTFIKPQAILELFTGCGELMEKWIYECVWPTSIDWGDLDMESSDIVYVDLTLRYARAYITNDPGILGGFPDPPDDIVGIV